MIKRNAVVAAVWMAALGAASGVWAQVVDQAAFGRADAAVEKAIAEGKIPGAVLVAGTSKGIVYQKAYGNKSVEPSKAPMTVDTIFDLASLSKSIGCATSVMKLIEQGKIDPAKTVASYLPEFGTKGKEVITVEDCLLHRGGLIPDNSIKDYEGSQEDIWKKICDLELNYPPKQGFRYSDVSFQVLGKLVERVSGEPLDVFAKKNVFGPAGMTYTAYNPPASWKGRIAPTEKRGGEMIVGEVHDPRAYAMKGVAGHAGVFGTAEDVAKWCQMLLRKGKGEKRQVLKPETVVMMTTPRTFADKDGKPVTRGFGVDVDSGFSPAPRGSRFEKGSTFGHTGFTGTCYWVDPVHDCFYVLLTNSVHMGKEGSAAAVRRGVATAVAEAFLGKGVTSTETEAGAAATAGAAAAQPAKRGLGETDPSAPAVHQAAPSAHSATTRTTQSPTAATPVVWGGIDVMAKGGFKQLEGRKIALITNHSGKDAAGNRTVDLINKAGNCKLVALFSPEHGLYGNVDEKVGHSVDPITGLKVWSLYGETRTPTKAMLEGVDTFVFDIQDAGVRFYTYSATLGNCMRVAAENGLKFVVLDRPNPLGGELVDGPVAEKEFFGFTAFGPMPIVHGMTFGELAQLYKGEWGIKCDLTVVPMEGWNRKMWFEETGMMFVPPSPNLRNLTQEVLYPGIALVEASNVSVGRGCDEPFEMVGAPWVDGRRLAELMNGAKLPGVRFVPIEFVPRDMKYKGQRCEGVHVELTDRAKFEAVRTGVTLAWALRETGGEKFQFDAVVRLLQNRRVFEAMKEAKDASAVGAIPGMWAEDVAGWKKTREKYLIYK